MSIARRLLLLLGVCCSALLLQGGLGLFQIRSINQNIAAIEDNVLPSLKSLEHAQTAFLLARVPATRYLFVAPEQLRFIHPIAHPYHRHRPPLPRSLPSPNQLTTYYHSDQYFLGAHLSHLTVILLTDHLITSQKKRRGIISLRFISNPTA